MVSFDEIKNQSLEQIAATRAIGDRPQGAYYMIADAVLRLREVEAAIAAAEATKRYARYTLWVAVFAAATAAATLLVALLTGLGT